MSVVNTMLRDLEARGDDPRKPKIPVRTAPQHRSGVLLTGAAVIAVSALAWQFLVPLLKTSDDASKQAAAAPAAIVHPVAASAATAKPVKPAPVQPSQPDATPAQTGANSAATATPAASQATPGSVNAGAAPARHASWQWSNDGFALQLDAASDIRYGVERVDADTVKIVLSHPWLATLIAPSPTPAWIDSVRIQRDGEQQTVTVSTQSRLEYDIAMLEGGALVISVWRDTNAAAADSSRVTAAVADIADEDTDIAATKASAASQVARVAQTAPRHYEKPRIDRSAMTSEQRDARQAAEASSQLRAGQQSQAITLLRNALQSDDAAPKSAALLVAVLMSQQRLSDAQPYLDRALRQTPQDPTLIKLKARMLAAQGETARARAVLASLSPATSSDPELLALAASLAQQTQDFAAASSHYLQWTRVDPNNGAAWYGLALAFDAQASSANAITAYRHALSLINDTRLREYANVRLAALQGTPMPGTSMPGTSMPGTSMPNKSIDSARTGAAVAR